jgi:hypothetical protein
MHYSYFYLLSGMLLSLEAQLLAIVHLPLRLVASGSRSWKLQHHTRYHPKIKVTSSFFFFLFSFLFFGDAHFVRVTPTSLLLGHTYRTHRPTSPNSLRAALYVKISSHKHTPSCRQIARARLCHVAENLFAERVTF